MWLSGAPVWLIWCRREVAAWSVMWRSAHSQSCCLIRFYCPDFIVSTSVSDSCKNIWAYFQRVHSLFSCIIALNITQQIASYLCDVTAWLHSSGLSFSFCGHWLNSGIPCVTLQLSDKEVAATSSMRQEGFYSRVLSSVRSTTAVLDTLESFNKMEKYRNTKKRKSKTAECSCELLFMVLAAFISISHPLVLWKSSELVSAAQIKLRPLVQMFPTNQCLFQHST